MCVCIIQTKRSDHNYMRGIDPCIREDGKRATDSIFIERTLKNECSFDSTCNLAKTDLSSIMDAASVIISITASCDFLIFIVTFI